MDIDAVIGCAQVLGWNVQATVTSHEIEIAETNRVKNLWNMIASSIKDKTQIPIHA